MTDIFISARRGAGAPAEILYGTVTFKPTLAHSRSTSIVLPAPTTFDLVDGEVVATNVQPTPEPVEGKIEWAYEVTFKDRHSKTYSFLVGVPDSTTQVNFTSLPRYFETKPPLFGQGPKGEPGESATIAVGTVTSGTTPDVTNSGTNTDAVLDFVLPKGDKGDTGEGVPAGGTALQYIRKDSTGAATEWATLSKSSVGLGDVDNTSDADKPVSNATQSAITALENRTDSNVADLLTNESSDTYLSAASKFRPKNELVVNVRDFGAVGDGVTDDSGAFKDAFLYVRNTFGQGGTVVAQPSGVFNLGSQTRIFSNTTVDLEYSKILRTAGSGYVAFCAVAGAAVTGYGSGAQNITLKRIRFQGDFANGRSLNNIFHHVDNLLIEDCVFDQAVTSGHAVDLGGCSNVTIRNCIFRGRYEVAGRAYVEAVQIDHSYRSGAGGELVENTGAWDGLPCINVTMEDCVSEPLTIGSTTYLAPRLIGSHSRVADLRHKNIKIRNVKITDSGPTNEDANYRGWIHFTHTENVTIEGYTAVNTRNDNAVVLGFGSVGTTYPLSSVASSSPSLTSDSGPIACRDIRAQVQIIGSNQTVMHDAVILAGQNGAPVENAVFDLQAKNLHSGDLLDIDSGGTVLNISWGWQVTANIQAVQVRRMVNAESSRYITANVQGRSVAHSCVRVATANNVQMSNAQIVDCATLGYFSGVTNLTLTGNMATSNGSTARPYDGMVSVAGCTTVNSSGNNFVNKDSSLIYGHNFYNTTTGAASNGNMGTGFTTVVRVQAGSTVTVANTVSN